MTVRNTTVLIVWIVAVTLERACWAGPTGDFDNDGFDDLVIGVPAESIELVANAGAINVIYGSASGLASAGNQFWHQDSPGLIDSAQEDDRFGSSTAVGDFDGDGFDDVAIGIPGEDVGGFNSAGAVHVLYGSASGLRAIGNQVWHQNSDGVNDDTELGDSFGSLLAAGDFDGDGRDDLAIGIPFESVGEVDAAGAVCVLYGSESGLQADGNDFWHQNVSGVRDVSEQNDKFGASLAVGDFDDDGRDDLAIGIDEEDVGSVSGAGAVQVIYGSATGLVAAGNQFWHQDSDGIRDVAEEFDFFGNSVAVGDFDADGFDDLAIGADREDVGTHTGTGAVNVIYGSADGLRAAANQIWSQNSSGVADACEANDHFGRSLISGDFDGDGFADLAIGADDETLAGFLFAGAVNVLYGASTGLTSTGNQFWHQNKSGVLDLAEVGDRFGFYLTMGDFDGNNADDLVAGVPEETVGGVASSGAVNVLYGTVNGLTSDGDQFWHQDRPGILDTPEVNDSFGFSSDP